MAAMIWRVFMVDPPSSVLHSFWCIKRDVHLFWENFKNKTDSVTIKRVSHPHDVDGAVLRTQLLSSNPKYAPITIGGPDETRAVRIMGRAIGFYKPIS